MICSVCGGEVIWKGPIIALTHTECQSCGAINSQQLDDPRTDLDDADDQDLEAYLLDR